MLLADVDSAQGRLPAIQLVCRCLRCSSLTSWMARPGTVNYDDLLERMGEVVPDAAARSVNLNPKPQTPNPKL
eukprot:1804140-Rhodomonas_salina.2